LDEASIRAREMRTDDDASEAGFIGSPTILVDGTDVLPPGGDEPLGLSCRIYRRRDGRISPTPDPEDLRDALTRALATTEMKSR
jgi:hypothetical protein